MTRSVACVAALLALVGCSLAADTDKSSAAVTVGIGDQTPSTFTDPLFKQLKIKRSRVFLPWNVVRDRKERQLYEPWFAAAEANKIEALVSFGPSRGSRCPKRPCKLPTTRQYTKAFRAFRKKWPKIKLVSPWNEANHRSQPTFKNPKRAAQYYNIVRKYCRGCKIVAADVIDEKNMEKWLATFKKTAIKPRIWGLHNYRDTNKRKGQRLGGTKRLLKTVKGQVWMTETGGIVRFVLPDGRTLFKKSEKRANSATKRMFNLARDFRSRVKRLYIYNWRAPLPDGANGRFDAGLLSETGEPRPAYRTVKRYLRASLFKP